MALEWVCWFWNWGFRRCNKYQSPCLLLRYISSHPAISCPLTCSWCPLVRKHVALNNPDLQPSWLMGSVCAYVCVFGIPPLCWWMAAVTCLSDRTLSPRALRRSSLQPPSSVYVSIPQSVTPAEQWQQMTKKVENMAHNLWVSKKSWFLLDEFTVTRTI